MIFTDRGKDAGILLLRIIAGGLLITHGFAKIANFSELSTTFFDPIGWGIKTSLIMIILAEVGASLFVILGALTRLAALALVFALAMAAFVAHSPFTLSGSELPLLYMVMFFVIMVTGGGAYSVDALCKRRLCKR